MSDTAVHKFYKQAELEKQLNDDTLECYSKKEMLW